MQDAQSKMRAGRPSPLGESTSSSIHDQQSTIFLCVPWRPLRLRGKIPLQRHDTAGRIALLFRCPCPPLYIDLYYEHRSGDAEGVVEEIRYINAVEAVAEGDLAELNGDR